MLAGASTERLHIRLQGAVQGAGFCPTIYRIAQKLRLAGWVRNTGTEIDIEVEGGSEQLATFLQLLKSDRSQAAVVEREEVSRIAPQRSTWFEILPTDPKEAMTRPPTVSTV
jgi:hydrogenase maturation protein HypF